MTNRRTSIGVIGLGYVGLPLAVAFAEKYPVTGLDYQKGRLEEIKKGRDRSREVSEHDLKNVLRDFSGEKGETGLWVTGEPDNLKNCNTYIVAVPTPVDSSNKPDLSMLIQASETVGGLLKKGDLAIFESTVYPGATEEVCVPVLENVSGLTFNEDFFVGYSPERINPGDPEKTFKKIRKVTSGSTPEVALQVDSLYASVVEAGTFMTSSIKVAEAAKVIENAQRDINIAFVNELAKLFSMLDIDTTEVLEAAATKWNFLPFKPGLVGGHCIGVDPYYLSHKAQETGYQPEIILAGRRTNDGMGAFVAAEIVKCMVNKNLDIRGAKVLFLGFTFKENCPDTRNTGVFSVYNELKGFGMSIDVCDPVADASATRETYGIDLIQNTEKIDQDAYQAIVLAVAHDTFKGISLKTSDTQVIYDVKSFLDREIVDKRL